LTIIIESAPGVPERAIGSEHRTPLLSIETRAPKSRPLTEARQVEQFPADWRARNS
jgi:hypothetical protein